MITNANKASRLFSLIPQIASLLRISLIFLILVGVAQAQSLNSNSESQSNKISPLLKGNTAADETMTVVVTLNGPTSGGLNGFMNRNGVRLRREMKALHSFSVSLPSRLIPDLASFPEVDHVSANSTVVGFGHAATTTGAAAGQAAASAAGRGTIDGAGVGIAILDSGIDVNHAQFQASGGGNRILASVDFTGENRTDDPFGHGTFVAAAAAGGAGAGSAYTGMAPGASLLNVRVLDSDGQGTLETVLAGLNWVATYARTHNIRVVNLSIGMRAVESYKYDALCRAVRGLVNSGILVVVAAGNEGKDSEGEKIYGSIHSPGIEPSAFTIGASNSFQTDGRSDDGVATYSSRGPTRGHWIDGESVVHHDNILKPDMVAPGNKLVFAQSPNNVLVTENPTLNES
ncbi:MAG TPA: S8 family serine peptidase, partial [Pyrinomonadaceae bacterium]|nr:S8 family serine peptidase [Pyrinomonadaceae bacterium]